MLPPPQALSDADALDQLLQLQLRLVDQKLALAKQTRALQPAAALQQPAGPWPPPSLPTRPASWPSTPPSALNNDQPWRQQLAAQQQRLDALARRNGELARQCAEAQQPAAEALRRPRPEPKGGRPGDVSHTEAMLQESLQMQKELLARLNREAEENEVRRMEAADEDAQWAAELEHMATEPLAPAFSHGPDGQARPASAGKGGRPRPARATAKEEELLKELAAAMDGLSDDDEEEAPTPRPGLERRASAKGLDKDVPEQGEQGRRFSIAALGFALLFMYKLRTKYSVDHHTPDEVTHSLEVLYEVAAAWLKRSLRAVVISVMRDGHLHLELSSTAGGRRYFGLLPASGGTPHDVQASKLKVRAKAVIDELATLTDPPAALLEQIHFLTSRRINWPPDVLYPSERAALRIGADGASQQLTAESPRVLTIGLVFTRTLLQRLLLQPRQAMLAPKTTPRGMANLRMIAAMLYVLGKAVPLLPLRPEVRGQRLLAALRMDTEATREFRGELERLQENGLPLLEEWLWEATAVLYRWTQSLLQASRRAAAVTARDED